jgi:hypothetical protein
MKLLEKVTRRSQATTGQESNVVPCNPLLHLFHQVIKGNARDSIWW